MDSQERQSSTSLAPCSIPARLLELHMEAAQCLVSLMGRLSGIPLIARLSIVKPDMEHQTVGKEEAFISIWITSRLRLFSGIRYSAPLRRIISRNMGMMCMSTQPTSLKPSVGQSNSHSSTVTLILTRRLLLDLIPGIPLCMYPSHISSCRKPIRFISQAPEWMLWSVGS
jgi:hypothetical protein